MRSKRWITALALLLTAGCGGGDAPTAPPTPTPLSVSITGEVREEAFNSATARWECHYSLTAATSGGAPGEFATWTASEVDFVYIDGTRVTHELDDTDVLDYWGSNRIGVGGVQVANRIAWAGQSFDLLYTFRLTLPTGELSSLHVFTCTGDPPPPSWTILVVETGTNAIREVSADGSVSSTFASGVRARGIAIEASGSVVVADPSGDLRRIAADGRSSSVLISGLGALSGVAVTQVGDFVVTEDASDRPMRRVTADGGSATVIANSIRSEDVEVDADGNFIVFQESEGMLLRVTPSGDVTELFGGLESPTDLVIEANGDFVVAEFDRARIIRIAKDGSSSTVIAGGFGSLEGVALTPLGDILISEFDTGRLWIMDREGANRRVLFEGLDGPDHIVVR